jgi:hypothetical protein
MKKKILIIAMLLTAIFWLNINNTFANSWTTDDKVTIVIVSEKVPWANCKGLDKTWNETTDNNKIISWKCEVWQWASTIVWMLWDIIRYFTYLAWLVWVLFIVYNGILYSMGWADQSLKEESKKRIIWTLIWLILLFLSGPILQLVAPWIYK